DHNRDRAVAPRADGARLPAAPLPRLGQTASGDGDALRILRLLAAPDNVGGEPARRDSVLPASTARRLAGGRTPGHPFSLRAAVRAAPVARTKAQARIVAARRRADALHARLRPRLLLRPIGSSRRRGRLRRARYSDELRPDARHDSGTRRHLALVLLRPTEGATAPAARSARP